MRIVLPPSIGEMKASARGQMLTETLRRILGRPVNVEVARSYEDLERRIRSGDFDLAWAPPALCGRVQGIVRSVLKAVRKGRSSYRAAIVCRADSPLSVDRLRGQRAAWVDPSSIGGYALPVALLRSRGVEPGSVLASQRFVGSYRDALLSVLDRSADLAPIYVGDETEPAAQATLQELVGGMAPQLRPFAFTGTAPNDGLVISSGVPAREAAALATSLTSKVASKIGSVLRDVLGADGFEMAAKGEYAGLARLTD